MLIPLPWVAKRNGENETCNSRSTPALARLRKDLSATACLPVWQCAAPLPPQTRMGWLRTQMRERRKLLYREIAQLRARSGDPADLAVWLRKPPTELLCALGLHACSFRLGEKWEPTELRCKLLSPKKSKTSSRKRENIRHVAAATDWAKGGGNGRSLGSSGLKNEPENGCRRKMRSPSPQLFTTCELSSSKRERSMVTRKKRISSETLQIPASGSPRPRETFGRHCKKKEKMQK